jgi:hypothetical protein
MEGKKMKNSSRFLVLVLILTLCFAFGCEQKEEKAAIEEKPSADLGLEQIPATVMEGLKAKFPQAEIHKWTQEKEGEIVIYDFEFTQEGQKFEADIKEDGSIYNWEKAIVAADLPEAVTKAVMEKYPGASMKEVMEITAVTEGQEELEGYEVVLETAEMTSVEVMVTPEGEITEDTDEDTSEEMSEEE